MQLIWHQRKDGLWNAACACNATICGVEFERRAQAEAWHFDRTRSQIPACGPKLPEPNPNHPDPFVFP